MDKVLTKQLLLSNSYWVLNKNMVKFLGLETAFLLSNFAEAEQIMADNEGWFYQTADTVEDMTTLSRHKQDQCIEQLEKQGILEKDVRGMPAKRYFRINYKCLANLFANNSQTSMQKINKLVCKKSATNKELNYKELNYKESNNTPCVLDKKEEAPEIPYKEIVDYLNKSAGSSYRPVTNKTRTLIKARFNESFTLEDFKKVIDIKVAEWKNTDMGKFLRPETLFGNKFEGYLNQGGINNATNKAGSGTNPASEYDFSRFYG